MTDISVVIPTFNRLWSLPKAVQSCLSTTAEVEIIVVDNGSTDGTWQHLMVYRKACAMLAERGELSARRKRAPRRFICSLMRELPKTHPAEAVDLYGWICELAPTFSPPIRRSLVPAYRMLGFRTTKRLVNIRSRPRGRP